jgi:hypothetical protein
MMQGRGQGSSQRRLITTVYSFELDFFGKERELLQGNDASGMLKIQIDYAFLYCFSTTREHP